MGHRSVVGVITVALALASGSAARAAGSCGAYAEDLTALSPQAREVESHAASYSVAVRTSATYECPWYAPDGSLRRTRQTVQAHGTAFGYRRDGGDTLLLTNDHVASWPAATDADHGVDGVPAGCRRISTGLKIVDDDRDNYAADDIPLSVVVTDPVLDVAVLRAHQKLPIIPWKVGTSAALATRDVVQIKGFPLGEFQATNVGKVTSPYDHDEQGDWNHDDFVVDALVSSGNSGSPVLAVSCKTGEFELVGIFHAHYNGASALNVVISIDQVRELMSTLKLAPRPSQDAIALDSAARDHVKATLAHEVDPPFFAFGSLTASVHERPDGALVFAVFAADFPHSTRPLFVVEDLAPLAGTAFGTLGAVYLGGASGLEAYAADAGDAEAQALLAHALDGLRRDAIATFEIRATADASAASRGAFRKEEAKRKQLARMLDAQHDTQQALVELAGRAPTQHAGDKTISLSQLETIGRSPALAAVKR